MLMPKKYKFIPDNIPAEIKALKGWAGMDIAIDPDTEKRSKTPISIIDKKRVGFTDQARLVDFDAAVKAYETEQIDIPVVNLSPLNGNIVAFDLDNHDPRKKQLFEEISQEILPMIKSYGEKSVSGAGYHLLIYGKKPEGFEDTDRHGIVEIHSKMGFLIVTGDVLPDHDLPIMDCQEALNKICEKYLLKKAPPPKDSVGKNLYSKSDQEVIEKIKSWKNGRLFWEGHWEEIVVRDESGNYYCPYPSQSEADYAFAGLLAFVTGNSPEQAKRLFLQSGMTNPIRQKKKSSGYIDHIISKASLSCTKVCDWSSYSYTDTEQAIDIERIVAHSTDNDQALVAKATQTTLALSGKKKLDQYLTKYIATYGNDSRDTISTALGDYDSGGNAIRFFLLHNQDLIYDPDGKEWLKWDGVLWKHCYDEDLIDKAEKVFYQLKHEAYNLFLRTLQHPNEKDQLEEQALMLFEYASTKKNIRNCKEMVEFSKQYFIKAQAEAGTLEKAHSNYNVINLKNGIYNFDSMTFIPHDKGFYQTRVAGVPYVETAKCPLWTDMIETVLPDPEIREFFQRAIGYTLSGECNGKSMFILLGSGENAKTTIIETLKKLFGQYGITGENSTIMETRFSNAGAPRPDLIALRDRRAAFFSETEKSGKLAEGLVKHLVGGGSITARTLNHEPVTFPVTFKIWLDTNFRPVTNGYDQALFRRFKIIKFDGVIPEEKRDESIKEQLNEELPGILLWGIEGYRMYKKKGLSMPDTLNEVVREYAEDMSPLDQWIKECIHISQKDLQSCFTSSNLYQSYNNWCKYNGEHAMGQRRFTQEINLKEPFKHKKTVHGYVQYKRVCLNEIGMLFTNSISDPASFATEYNRRVAKILSESDS